MDNKIESSWEEAGKFLRELRHKTGLSIFKVAKRTHISGNYLSLIERGKQLPSNVVLYNLAEFYQIDSSELFRLFNKIESDAVKEALALPSIKRVLTEISMEENLTIEEKEEVARELYKTAKEIISKKRC